VILPRLSEQHATASAASFSDTLDWALRLVFVIGVPAALGLALLAEPLLVTLFFRGEFMERDVAMATASLQAYAPGLLGFILVKVLAPGYFARQDTRTPVRIGLQALTLGMVLSIAFVLTLLQTEWAPAHAGIAAATACSGLLNAGLLLIGLKRQRVYAPHVGWSALALRIALPSTAMVLALVAGLVVVGDWFSMSLLERLGNLAALVLGGAAVYFVACYAVGLRANQFRIRSVA
jgi:putative peptidoglycan lipid II flippase